MKSTLLNSLADMAWRDKQFAVTMFWPWILFALFMFLLATGILNGAKQ